MSKRKSPSRKPDAKAAPAAEAAGMRAKLIAVSRRLFAERGLAGVSVRDIAKAAKTNVSQVSYYFGGKEGLYREILESHFRVVSADLGNVLASFRDSTPTKETFQNEIRTIVGLLIEMRSRSPDIAIIMQWERISGLPYCHRIYEELLSPLSDEMVALVTNAQKKGVLRKDLNARAFFILMMESIFGYYVFHDCGLKIWGDAYRLPKDKDQFIDFLVRLYTEGTFA